MQRVDRESETPRSSSSCGSTGDARGAGEPALAGQGQLERGMMTLGTGGGFHVLDQGIPHPLQLGGCRGRFPGRVARGRANEQLGLIDLHQVQKPQVDSQLALLTELGRAELLLACECLKPAREPGRVLASTPCSDGPAPPPQLAGRCSSGRCVRAAGPAGLRVHDAGCWPGPRGS